MANGYQNSIMLGVKLPQQKDIQGQLDSLIKELNNSKIQLDVGFKDNTVVATLEKLNDILNKTKSSASGINLGNVSSSLKQVTEEALKLTSELKGVGSVNLKISDGELKNVKVTMQDTEAEAKKLKQSLADTNGGSFFSGISDFMAKAGLFYGMAQAIQEVKQQLENCFEQAKKFDQAFTDISITMDISKAQFADMSDKITQMGIEYGKSSNEILKIARTYANAQSSVDEVMQKVKPDLWLANVSRIDSADITATLQSVNNQFELMTKEGMNAEQATMKVGNSLVATSRHMQYDFVDGIKKITEAVKVGGSIANNAKMSLDDFISMTGAFVQQSGMSGSEFANALKMISARVLKQKELGAELGISEKEMADAEKTLDRFNISTRDTGGNLRSLTDILRDTSVVFNKMSDSDRQYVANKLAGVNQSARFIDIMKSMNNQQLLYNATQTETTALMDAQNKYADSLEGRLGSLEATYEGLMNKMMNSDQAKWLVTEATNFLNVLGQVDGKTIAFTATMGGLILVISKLATLNKTLIAGEAVTGLSKFIGLASGLTALEGGATGVGTAFTFLGTSIKTATANSLAFIATPIGAVLATIGAVIGIAVAGFVAYKEHQEELAEQSKELKKALEGVNEALANGDTKTASMTADKMREEQKALTDLINKRKELEASPEPNTSDYYKSIGGADKAESIALVTSKIDEQIKKIKDAGMAVDETTGKIQQLQEVQDKIVNQNIVDKIKSETKAQVEHRENIEANTQAFNSYISTVQQLYGKYQNLESQENLSAEQKEQLASIVEQLQGKIGNLDVQMDANGKTYITNQGLIQDTISYMNSEGQTVEILTQIKLADQKSNATWQWNNTTLTYQQTLQRIQYYRSEIAEIQKLMQARLEEASQIISHKDAKGNYDTSPDRANQAEKDYMSSKRASDARIKNANDSVSSLQAGINNIDKLYSSMELPSPSKSGGSASTDEGGSKGKKGKSAETIAKEEHEALVKEEKQKVQDVLDIYNDAKNEIENNIGEIDYSIKMLGDADGSNVTQRVDLINQKLGEQKKVADEAQKQLDSLKNTTVSTSEAQKELTSKTLSASKELRDEKLAVADLQKQLKEIEKDTLKKYFDTEQKEKTIELEVKQKKDNNDLTKTIFGVPESDWNSYIENKKEQINNEISDLQERANADSDNASALDAIKVKQEELNDLEKQSYNNITDFQQVYEDIHKQRVSEIDEKLKALEKTHDAEKKENELLEKKKSLTEAQIALDKAKNDKSLYQYKKNEQTGVWDFEWVANQDNIKTVQDTYDKAKKEYDDFVKEQDYDKKKSDLEQQKADEETILNVKKDSYDRQQKVLEKSQELEKTTLENHYSDMTDLIQKEMDGYIQTYGDNWKTIVDNTNKSFEEIEKKYKELSTMKATVGLDKMADSLLDNTTISSDGTKDVYDGKINNKSNTSNSDIINNQSQTIVKEKLQQYDDNLQAKLDIMVKYSDKMLTIKEAFEKAMQTLQNNSQDNQYNSLTAFAIKYTTFTDKFLEMLQLIYDFRYTNIVNLSTQMQDLIKSALLSCEEAYKDFVKMSSAMGIKVDSSVDISSALYQMEKYKQSVNDWAKTKEDVYKNEKNNPLYNAASLSDYNNKYNPNANDIYNNMLSSYNNNDFDNFVKQISAGIDGSLLNKMNNYSSTINLNSLDSSLGNNITTNNKSTESTTNYNINKIELNATDDPIQTFNNIASYVNQKASLKK